MLGFPTFPKAVGEKQRDDSGHWLYLRFVNSSWPIELKLQSGILHQKTSFQPLLAVLRKTNPKESQVNEVHRFIHSLINQIMNYLFIEYLLYDGHCLRWCWGSNGEFKRTSVCHHGADSLVGEEDTDPESHTKKCKVVNGRTWRKGVSNRGLTCSERSGKVSRESKV